MHNAMKVVALVAALVPAAVSAALAVDYFGAIAYAPSSRQHGYAYDFTSQSAAEQAALDECNKRSSGCQSAIWFRNACGALAVGDGGWGASWGEDQQLAEGKSLQKCYEYTTGCKIERWVCTKR